MTSARELLALIRRAGVALFQNPLTGDQARLAAAIARKSEALSARLAEPLGESRSSASAPPADAEAPKLDLLLEEAVAFHQALAVDRGVTLELSLAANLPQPSRSEAGYELALDLLLGAVTELSTAGERVTVQAGTGLRALRLIVRLQAAREEDVVPRLAAVAAALASHRGALRHTAAGPAVEIVVDLPAAG